MYGYHNYCLQLAAFSPPFLYNTCTCIYTCMYIDQTVNLTATNSLSLLQLTIVFGTAKTVLYIEVSLFQSVLIHWGVHCRPNCKRNSNQFPLSPPADVWSNMAASVHPLLLEPPPSLCPGRLTTRPDARG